MKKRALISAIAMLVVSAIVLTSATFAWFSMGKVVTVEEFKVGVSEADGLLISATETGNFGTTVTLAQIRAANNTATKVPAEGGVVSPVSSNGNGTFVGGFYDESNTLQTSAAEDGSYYAFPVFIKYSGANTATISLTGSTITAGTGDKGTSAYKASRVALDASDFVCAPNTTDADLTYIAAAGSSPIALSNSTKNFGDIQFTIDGGETKKVMVYVWLEGEDADCTDELAAGGNFNVALKFTKA